MSFSYLKTRNPIFSKCSKIFMKARVIQVPYCTGLRTGLFQTENCSLKKFTFSSDAHAAKVLKSNFVISDSKCCSSRFGFLKCNYKNGNYLNLVRQLATKSSGGENIPNPPTKNNNENLPEATLSKPRLTNILSLNADEVITKKPIGQKRVEELKQNWDTVYRFTYIRMAGIIQRLKLIQTGITCFFIFPVSATGYFYETISEEVLLFSAGASGLACLMLYIMGTFCSRLIGFIYTSKKDPNVVRIAHMSFWGSRKDDIYDKSDFVPFSELEDNISDLYINVKFYSDRDAKLHLCLRYGLVYDRDQFKDIFGTHSLLTISQVDNNKKTKKKI